MRGNVARSMFAMSLNMPDPHADVPGTTKIYDAGHPCCDNAPNVRFSNIILIQTLMITLKHIYNRYVVAK